MKDFLRTILEASDTVNHKRSSLYAFNYALGEMKELEEEFVKAHTGQEAGSDGILGEAIDVIQCLVDIIRLEHPTLSHDELVELMTVTMQAKCQKWLNKFPKNEVSLHGDVAILTGDTITYVSSKPAFGG